MAEKHPLDQTHFEEFGQWRSEQKRIKLEEQAENKPSGPSDPHNGPASRVVHACVVHARVVHTRVVHVRVAHVRVVHARVVHARVVHARAVPDGCTHRTQMVAILLKFGKISRVFC